MTLNKTKETIIAAIDIGTNSAHLVIASIDEQEHLTILDTYKTILRLGDELSDSKQLSEDAINKTIVSIQQMKEIASSYNPIYRAIATYAARSARNYLQFINEIYKKTNIEVSIIDGIEEARLISLGMLSSLQLNDKNFLSLDIGGGSTEISICHNEKVKYITSLPLGCVTLSKRYLYPKGNFIKAQSILSLEKKISMQLAPISVEANKKTYELALMSSGTAKALASMDYYQKNKQELSDPNGYVITSNEINGLVKKTKSLHSPSKIKKYWNLDSNRSELILAGASILNIITNLFNIKEWTVSSRALREGLVVDTYRRLQPIHLQNPQTNIRWKSIIRLGKKLEIDQIQSEQVLHLSNQIYNFVIKQKLYKKPDNLSSLLNNELLQAAAWLHECGKFISFPRFHRHSSYLISHYRLMGFSQKERLLIGLIARYHRKGSATKRAPDCELLNSQEIDLINLLASILRIASAANRTRKKLIKDFLFKVSDQQLIFLIIGRYAKIKPSLDIDKMNLEKESLEKITGYPIKIKQFESTIK